MQVANAVGSITTAGAITVANADSGSGYSGKPQVVVSGGGWRLGPNSDNATANMRCNYILGASSGIFIQRQKAGGQKHLSRASILSNNYWIYIFPNIKVLNLFLLSL